MTRELETLSTLVQISASMADAAERQAWNELTGLGERYFSLFSTLPPTSERQSEPNRKKRIELLQTLAKNEEQVRGIVVPWMDHTRKLLAALTQPAGGTPDPSA